MVPTPSRPAVVLIAALIAALPLSPLGSLAATPASAPVPSSRGQVAALSPAEARAIAKEAWLYAYAPLQGYQTLWNQTQNKAFPGYVGGFDRFRHYLLPFMPAVPSERAMRARFARIGIGPGLPFDPARLDPKLRTALEEGVAEASQELKAKAQQQTSSQGFFGSRQQLGSDYLTFRSMGAMLGIYGNSSEEAF